MSIGGGVALRPHLRGPGSRGARRAVAPVGILALLAALLAALLVLPVLAAGAQERPSSPEPVDVDLVPDGSGGYWVTYADGRVESREGAPAVGSVSVAPGESIVALVPAAAGHWLITDLGRVLPVGGAPHLGDMSEVALNGAVIAAVPTTTGAGYVLLGSDGGIFSFGDAAFQGSVQGILDE
ncbi:MAG TPA: hypothetical protein DEP66_03735, partial [Acidimicrobiaceae bacterium]|nr:hypothetical protein [Acidimicrobiaceae bacterium]